MDSPSIFREKISKWSKSLSSGEQQSQIETLRQISNEDCVIGLALETVGLAGSPDDEVRVWAAEAMETAIQPEPADMKQLIELMEQSPDGEVCYWATTMLGRLGIGASAAAASLEDCLIGSTYLAARERAVWALSQIGPKAAAAIPALKKVAGEMHHPRLARLANQVANRLVDETTIIERRKRA